MAAGKLLYKYGMTTLGCVLMAASINCFFLQHHFLSGGLAGLSMILYYLFQWPAGTTSFLMNIPLFFLAYRYMGKLFCFDSLVGSLIFSVVLDGTSFLQSLVYVDDPLLSCLAGGVMEGLGCALVYRAETSTGGIDILGSMTKKYYNISVSTTNFIYSLFLMAVAVFFFGLEPVLYSTVIFFLAFKATNFFMLGFDYKKTVLIISSQSDAIGQRIMSEVNRGITILHGEGGYSHAPQDIILVVVKLTQLAHLNTIIKEVDPMAFVTVQDTNDVFGRGFTAPNVEGTLPPEWAAKKAQAEAQEATHKEN